MAQQAHCGFVGLKIAPNLQRRVFHTSAIYLFIRKTPDQSFINETGLNLFLSSIAQFIINQPALNRISVKALSAQRKLPPQRPSDRSLETYITFAEESFNVASDALKRMKNSFQFSVFSFQFAVQGSHLLIDVTQSVDSELKTEN
jgi:hypothetical protein